MRYAAIRTTEYLLIEWAKWQSCKDNGLGFPHIEPHEKLRAKVGAGWDISDDEAMRVDGVVSKLQYHRPDQWSVVVDFYIKQNSRRKIGRERGIHHSTVSDLLNGGREWIDGALRGGAG